MGFREMMLNFLSCMGRGVAVRKMKNMRHFLIRGLGKGTLGVGLVVPVEELVSNPNASSGELPLSSLLAQG